MARSQKAFVEDFGKLESSEYAKTLDPPSDTTTNQETASDHKIRNDFQIDPIYWTKNTKT